MMMVLSVGALVFMAYQLGNIRGIEKMDKASTDFWKEVEKRGL